MSQPHQSTAFNDRPGIYEIRAGRRIAYRDSRAKAFRYAHEAARRGDIPMCIINVGQNERLDFNALQQGWGELDLPILLLNRGRLNEFT
jgi:hypothetical protein